MTASIGASARHISTALLVSSVTGLTVPSGLIARPLPMAPVGRGSWTGIWCTDAVGKRPACVNANRETIIRIFDSSGGSRSTENPTEVSLGGTSSTDDNVVVPRNGALTSTYFYFALLIANWPSTARKSHPAPPKYTFKIRQPPKLTFKVRNVDDRSGPANLPFHRHALAPSTFEQDRQLLSPVAYEMPCRQSQHHHLSPVLAALESLRFLDLCSRVENG